MMEQALGPPSLIRQVPLGAGDTMTVGRWQHGDARATTQAGDGQVTVVFNLSNSQRVERLQRGAWSAKSFDIGSVTVVGPEDETIFSVQGHADILQLFLPVRSICRALGSDKQPAIASRFQEHDPEIERCALQALIAARKCETQDDLRLAEIASRLAARLADQALTPTPHRVGGLPPHRLRRIQELVAHHLATPGAGSPSLDELASEAELSVFHFARAFRKTVGATPHAYVLRRRLELARTMLATSSRPIAEIARQTGFTSQAHFSDRFRREIGVTPGRFRCALRS